MATNKLVFTAPPLELAQTRLAAETSNWLRTHENSRLWELELGFLRVMAPLPADVQSKVWAASMQLYFDSGRD